MRDRRLQVFRTAVDGLIESLDAVVRLSRWNDEEPKPEPLVTAAAKLLDRLGAADRLAASRFNGPAPDVAKVTAMCAVLKRLDAAYLAYCKQIAVPQDTIEAAAALEAEVSATSALARNWA